MSKLSLLCFILIIFCIPLKLLALDATHTHPLVTLKIAQEIRDKLVPNFTPPDTVDVFIDNVDMNTDAPNWIISYTIATSSDKLKGTEGLFFSQLLVKIKSLRPL